MERASVVWDQPVDLEALDAELGGHGLCQGDGVVCVADGSPVTQAVLEAALGEHVPPPRLDPQAEFDKALVRARSEPTDAARLGALFDVLAGRNLPGKAAARATR